MGTSLRGASAVRGGAEPAGSAADGPGGRPGRTGFAPRAQGWNDDGLPARGPRVCARQGAVRPAVDGPGRPHNVAEHGPMRERALTTLEDATVSPAVTPVVLGGARGGPDVATLRDGPLLGPARRDVRRPHVVRGLRQLGRLRQQELLRGRLVQPRPDLALLLPLPDGELRARAATPRPSSPGGRSRRPSSS